MPQLSTFFKKCFMCKHHSVLAADAEGCAGDDTTFLMHQSQTSTL